MNNANMEAARNVYSTVCTALDEFGLNYEKSEEKLLITFCLQGDDMEHELSIMVNPKHGVIQLAETLPFVISEERAADFAAVICYVNEALLNGKFSSELKESVHYNVTQIYSGSLVGVETIKQIILSLVYTVEEYDDKFLSLNNGYLKPEDFILWK